MMTEIETDEKTNKITEITELYKKAVNLWGREAQILMVIEEMSELSTYLCHQLRGRKIEIENIAEEIADVEIMLTQLKFILNIESDVFNYKKSKLITLDLRIKEEINRKIKEKGELKSFLTK